MKADLPVLTASLPDVWQGRRLHRQIPALASGHAALDSVLPGGGWPLGAATEILTGSSGAGEFSLLFPAMAQVTSRAQWVIMVDPPWIPYAPAMRGHGIDLQQLLVVRSDNRRESDWACEQVLRGVRGGMVLAWQDSPRFSGLRRLQLAARSGHKPAFLFRPPEAAAEASPATLRLRLTADPTGTRVTLLKCRGRRPGESVLLRRSPGLPGMSALPVAPVEAAVPAAQPVPPRAPQIERQVH
ncbi:MAG: translesion DNA synthesis-associated protein ImuA [Xanthomonadales bacterium]|nr:translesion DNA synthesis-associated protein ImuA [Xanthomonadales bacterium]